MDFLEFAKIPRLKRDCTITEKIDGTNGQLAISDDGLELFVGSRSRWLSETADNYGFFKWATANRDELMKLGPGRHYGEWWGPGIQRGYGRKEKVFSLFNTSRWMTDVPPTCCEVVPILYNGLFDTARVDEVLAQLAERGSSASPGFMRPEGVVIYHHATRSYFKRTVEKDESRKGDQ